MESKKRKHNDYQTCQNLQNSNSVSSECINEQPESEKDTKRNRLLEENESCDFRNNKSNTDNESDSDTRDILENNQLKEINKLQKWIVSKNIPNEHADDLLNILRQRLLPNLPKTTDALLKIPPVINIENNEDNDQSENSCLDPFLEVNIKEEPFLQLNENSLNFNDRDSIVDTVFNPLDIPIIEIQNVESSKSDFQRNILKQLSEINKNISILRQRQDDMMNFLIDKKVIPKDPTSAIIDFYQRHQLKLPLETMTNFLEFDERLKTDKFLWNDVCSELRRLVDKDYSISKSYVQMLKKFLSKDVALQFTAVRKSRNSDKESKLFKPTEFCKCMDAALTFKRSETALTTTNSMLITGLSDVLCNVNKWNKLKEV